MGKIGQIIQVAARVAFSCMPRLFDLYHISIHTFDATYLCNCTLAPSLWSLLLANRSIDLTLPWTCFLGSHRQWQWRDH